ncbi:MAG: UV DNA damage repair endonuclease UvsE [Dehalococcoidia bacterium]
MRIGYPCINLSLDCRGDRTFRLKSYSEERLIATVRNNLECLLEMLRYNSARNILFFRITSDLVPFASHPVNQFNWPEHFKDEFKEIGSYVFDKGMRISMHPDQFIVINSPDTGVWERSLAELVYHAIVLDAMELDISAKIQIHVGGVYGDKYGAISTFIERYQGLPVSVRRRLVIENDDRLYTLSDCLQIGSECGIPVLFDTFHHQVNSSGEGLKQALEAAGGTWQPGDGLPMVDYSSQLPGMRSGQHAQSLDEEDFRRFLTESKPHDFDVMLEIKDKEISCIRAITLARSDRRFVGEIRLLNGLQ